MNNFKDVYSSSNFYASWTCQMKNSDKVCYGDGFFELQEVPTELTANFLKCLKKHIQQKQPDVEQVWFTCLQPLKPTEFPTIWKIKE